MHPGNCEAWTREVIRCTAPAESALTKHLLPELLGPGKGTKHRPNQICAFVEYPEPEPQWLRPGKCMQPRAHLGQFLAEQPGV